VYKYTSIHLCAFVGFDIVSNCFMHGYGSYRKGNRVPVHALQACRREYRYIHKSASRSVRFKPGETTPTTYWKLGGPQKLFGCFGEKSLILTGNQTRIAQLID
jgi:hypothetical protein